MKPKTSFLLLFTLAIQLLLQAQPDKSSQSFQTSFVKVSSQNPFYFELTNGETKTVKFSLCADDLSIVDIEGNSVPAEGDIEISLGGGQPSNELITANKAVQKVISLSGRQ